VTAYHWVFDSGALLAYVHGVEAVGQLLVDVADADIGATVGVPLTCLIEAYSLLRHDEHDLLGLLRRNPAVRTVHPAVDVDGVDDCALIGGMAQRTGRLGAGHAALLALVNAAPVVTSRPDQLRAVLGADWEILEV
jgi:hypothetical protein